MKINIVFILLLGLFFLPAGQYGANKHSGNTLKKWPYKNFAYAKAYLYNLENKLYGKHAIIKWNKLDKTVVSIGIRLKDSHIKRIIKLTNQDIDGLLLGLSKSYIPHHGIVFFDKKDFPLAYITLCFDGEAMRISPAKTRKIVIKEVTDQEEKRLLTILEEFKKIILDLDLPVFKNPMEYKKFNQSTSLKRQAKAKMCPSGSAP
jgi:uncharacterized protein (UPF0248 family)